MRKKVIQVGNNYKKRETLDKIANFVVSVDKECFYKIFGKSNGVHLWNKMTKTFNGNFTGLFVSLNNSDRQKIVKYINETSKLR